ncbi:hypothetical protein BGW37DRAFT_464154 [Umbelopsis sp. PMI_123]|nr:hypothetical protein BGW37DRAFT_464154 [Umbelopsis sp. PMI_123]
MGGCFIPCALPWLTPFVLSTSNPSDAGLLIANLQPNTSSKDIERWIGDTLPDIHFSSCESRTNTGGFGFVRFETFYDAWYAYQKFGNKYLAEGVRLEPSPAPLLLSLSIDVDELIKFMEILKQKPFGDMCKHVRFDEVHCGFAAARGNWEDGSEFFHLSF